MDNLEDENAIDLETLQAQIDLSMSFAQDMVSSWMKSNHRLPSRAKDAEAELKDYLKRPPRLGVGAAVPENAVSSRDVARLKGQLTDKKRLRDEEAHVKKEGSDDEEESRGGAVRKKPRIDPFQVGGKKNKEKKTLASPSKEPAPTVKVEPESSRAIPEPTVQVQSTPKKSRKQSPPSNSSPLIPTSLPPLDPSLSTSPSYARRLAQAAELFKGPVLNLDEPGTDGEGSDDNTEKGPSENRKKRKRRKKKKHSISNDPSVA